MATRTQSGVLVLHKPTGISSRQAVDRVAGVCDRVKIGHAGTLDPMASGVLVLCLGKATRLVPFVQRMDKQYEASIRLGQRSSTHDLESAVEQVVFEGQIDRARFELCLSSFQGSILQVPPQHSAVHVRGRRAYELARRGAAVALEPRSVLIAQIRCTHFDYPWAELNLSCSAGTYVRSLVRDLGDRLGCGAVMTRLVRTAVGRFRVEDSVALDQLTAENLPLLLLPPIAALAELPVMELPEEYRREIAHGRMIPVPAQSDCVAPGQPCALCDPRGDLLGVAEYDAAARSLRPRIVLIDS